MPRKHQAIIQSGGNKGKLKKGYRYSGKKLKNGLPQIVKTKKTKKTGGTKHIKDQLDDNTSLNKPISKSTSKRKRRFRLVRKSTDEPKKKQRKIELQLDDNTSLNKSISKSTSKKRQFKLILATAPETLLATAPKTQLYRALRPNEVATLISYGKLLAHCYPCYDFIWNDRGHRTENTKELSKLEKKRGHDTENTKAELYREEEEWSASFKLEEKQGHGTEKREVPRVHGTEEKWPDCCKKGPSAHINKGTSAKIKSNWISVTTSWETAAIWAAVREKKKDGSIFRFDGELKDPSGIFAAIDPLGQYRKSKSLNVINPLDFLKNGRAKNQASASNERLIKGEISWNNLRGLYQSEQVNKTEYEKWRGDKIFISKTKTRGATRVIVKPLEEPSDDTRMKEYMKHFEEAAKHGLGSRFTKGIYETF